MDERLHRRLRADVPKTLVFLCRFIFSCFYECLYRYCLSKRPHRYFHALCNQNGGMEDVTGCIAPYGSISWAVIALIEFSLFQNKLRRTGKRLSFTGTI